MTEKDNLKDVQENEEYIETKDGTQVFMRSWLPVCGTEGQLLRVSLLG